MKLCFELENNPNPDWPIQLWQRGEDNFRVVYGQQIEDYLNYTTAARRLGAAIMHSLACEGKLDNGER